MGIPGLHGAVGLWHKARDFLGNEADSTVKQAETAFNGAKAEAGRLVHWGQTEVKKAGHIVAEEFRGAVDRVRNWPESPEVDVGTPSDEINKLNSDGDRVVISVMPEGKIQAEFGLKGQYGYTIAVEQVGDAPKPGSSGAPATYNVTFDKSLLAGAYAELPVIIPFLEPVSDLEPVSELNSGLTDTVTMSFASKADAARAVEILGGLAANRAGKDVTARSNPLANPLADQTLAQGGGGISRADADFLQQNMTSFSTTLSGQARNKVKTELLTLGIEPRFDTNAQITRTIVLPRNGQPGRLTYTVSGDETMSTKQKIGIPLEPFPDDILKLELSPQNIADNGRLSARVSVSWDLPPSAFTHTIAGRPVPEASVIDNMALGAPDSISARLQFDYQKPDIEISRTNLGRFTLEATADLPGRQELNAVNDLLRGNTQPILGALRGRIHVTASHQDIERHGFKVQPELGFEAFKLTEMKASVILEYGRDDLMHRHDISIG